MDYVMDDDQQYLFYILEGYFLSMLYNIIYLQDLSSYLDIFKSIKNSMIN